jgi:hypothetical protein
MPNSELHVVTHRRQFVLSSAPVVPGPDWQSIPIPDGFHVSHQSDLQVRSMDDDGRASLLLGYALPATPNTSGDLAKTLAGRFAWIEWPYLYPDAGALLPIYYGNTPDGPLITSSISLAAQAIGSTIPERPIARLALNWTIPPATPLPGFRKLMRDQRLHIPTAKVEYIDRALRPIGSFEQARESLATDLTTIVSALREAPGTIYLALTSGIDSRTLLAASLAADLRFECVTQTFEGVNRNDVDIACTITRHLGLKHHLIGPEDRDERVYHMWREHSAATYNDADNEFLLPQNQYRFLQPGDVLLRAHCFGLGKNYNASSLSGLDFSNATGDEIWSRFKPGKPNPEVSTAFDEWIAWRREHDNGLSLPGAFYLDQRIGGWVSLLEHGLDMLPGVPLPPANCDRIFSALITPCEEDRESKRLQRETIERLAPGLTKFPINPVTLRDRATNLLRRGKRGIKRRLKEVLPPSLLQRTESAG